MGALETKKNNKVWRKIVSQAYIFPLDLNRTLILRDYCCEKMCNLKLFAKNTASIKRIRPDACVRCDASQKRPEIMPASFMDMEIAHLARLKSLGHLLLWCCQQALCRLE